MRRALKDAKEVAHFWANKVQSDGYCGNMRFEGPRIYSYAECIAVMYEKLGKGTLVLRTVRDWSMTTAKHKSYVGGAWGYGRDLIDVPIFDNPSSKEDHLENLRYLLGQYTDAMKKAEKARTRGEMHREMALRATQYYDRYAEFFGLKERFDEGAAKRLEKQVKAEEAKRERQRKADEAKRAEKMKEALAEWREGGDRDLWGLPYIALRLHTHHAKELGHLPKQTVETTRGARIPLDDAKRLWPLIQRTRRGERDYDVGMPLGDYRLTKIRRDGSIVVGCHDIPYSEIEGIAKKLGLVEEVTA